jgi:uncharacterized phage protein (TIGR01671 family)
MDREIKFRGLYQIERTGEKRWDEYGISTKPTLIGAFWITKDLQYIGLNDINNKNIYDGDILKLKCYKIDRSTQERISFYRYSVVEWYQSKYSVGWRLKNKSCCMMIKPMALVTMEAEIIGSIFENPELLEVKK